MSASEAFLASQLAWVRSRYADQLTTRSPAESDRVLREGLILLIDMRFNKPPPQLFQRILQAPLPDVVRWSAMAFQVGGLVAACEDILQSE